MKPSLRHPILALLVLLVLLFHCLPFALGAPVAGGPPREDAALPAAPRYLARMKQGIRPEQAAAELERHQVRIRRSFRLVPGLLVLEDKNVPGAAPLEQRMHGLLQSGLFHYVEPDQKVRVQTVPSDTYYQDGKLWGLSRIEAARAWDVTTGSTNVIVAVIDSGIRATHQDLASQMWRNPGEIPGNGIDDDGDGYVDNVYGINAITGSGDPNDDRDHGTHVAGIIGAAANNGAPHVGVAWQVRLMACKFLNADGVGFNSDAIECINFAVAKGARILNNSWGGVESFCQALLDTIAAARDAGVLFVASAGNEGRNNDLIPRYPSSYPVDNILVVAAINANGTWASFSCYGTNSVHVAASGRDIWSCLNSSDAAYGQKTGTSMAAPFVSGVAALLLARHPEMSVVELRQRILETCVPESTLAGRCQSGGWVNAYRALTAQPSGTLKLTPYPSPTAPFAAGTDVTLEVSVTDLAPIQNATVIAQVPGGPVLTLLNNGVSPDRVAGDHIHTAILTVPSTGNTLAVTLTAAAPGKTTTTTNVMLGPIGPPPPPPFNNQFANRISFCEASVSFVATGSNHYATKESGEPNHAGSTGGASVWWSWRAPVSGRFGLTTEGSDFNTLLAVYTNDSIGSLRLIGANDDIGGGNKQSLVVFEAT